MPIKFVCLECEHLLGVAKIKNFRISKRCMSAGRFVLQIGDIVRGVRQPDKMWDYMPESCPNCGHVLGSKGLVIEEVRRNLRWI